MAFRIRDLAVRLELGRRDGLFLSCTQPSCTGESEQPSVPCGPKPPHPKPKPEPRPRPKYVPEAGVSDLALLQQQLRRSLAPPR